MSRHFVLGSDGVMYDLCDCGDFNAAEESSKDVLPDGVIGVWLADEVTAMEWATRIIAGCADAASVRYRQEKYL